MKRPLFLCMIGLVLGEAAAISMGWKGGLISVLIFLMAGFFLWIMPEKKQDRFSLFFFAFIGGLFLGVSAGKQSYHSVWKDHYSIYGTVFCRVLELKETSQGNYVIIVDQISFKQENMDDKKSSSFCPIEGKCRITGISKESIILYPDDCILCKGKMCDIEEPTNPGEFDTKTYYLSQGIIMQFMGETCRLKRRPDVSFRKTAYCLREQIADVYRKVMSEEQAALLQAMILGEKDHLSEEQKTLYEENGVAHLLAVSGLHVSIVGGKVFQALRQRGISYGVSCLGGGALLLFYGCVTGFGHSVLRAIFMYLFYLGAEFFGAEYDLVSAMGLSAILMLVEQPWRLYEGGFQISFISVMSIGLILPWVEQLIADRSEKKEEETLGILRWRKQLKKGLTASLVISGTTLPFLLRHFYEWSPYSILLNLIVIPCMTPLMIGGICCGFVGLITLKGAFLLSRLPNIILSSFQWIFEKVRMVPGALWITGCPSLWQMAGIYLLEFLLILCWYYHLWWKMAAIMATIFCLFFFPASSTLRITMLDVGQGDGIFLKMPDGHNVLMDGGSSSRKKVGKYVLLPAVKYYGAASLDYVIITHMDEDHISGMEEIIEQGFPVKHLIMSELLKTDMEAENLCELAEKNGTETIFMKQGEQLVFDEVKMICLHPSVGFSSEDRNAASLVFYLKYGDFDSLFTGDLEETGEKALCDYVRKNKKAFSHLTSGLELLKVAHHGSKYSTNKELLRLICPKTALISVGKKNRYGHPHQELLGRLGESDCEILQTRYEGAIEIKTDGNTWEILQ